MTNAELRKADVISQDKIWREAINAEADSTKKWQTAWGFLLEGDSQVCCNTSNNITCLFPFLVYNMTACTTAVVFKAKY